MSTPSDLHLAHLAVQRALTTEERIRESLELQRRGRRIGFDEPLSGVLVKRGYLREDDQRALDRDVSLWRFVRSEERFARRLVERGALGSDDARAYLQQARSDGFRARIGDALVERGRIDRALRDAVAREVVGEEEAGERSGREADTRDGTATAPLPPEEVGEPIGPVQPRALASWDRDLRRYGQSGDWAGKVAPGAIEGFELQERVGQGPHGVVFRARHAAKGEVVALKVLAPALASAPSFLAAFRRSWSQALALEHAGLVRLGAPGRSGELAYFTSELVDGDPLGTLVERGGPLSVERATAVVRGVLQALERAHQAGVTHGALSPWNVLVRRGSGSPVVTDLALSGVSGVGPGAALYASPQRLTAAAPLSPADDIYAVGALTYLLVVGRPPFADASPTSRLAASAPDPREADAKIDARVAGFIESTTRPDPAERPTDATAALAVLERGAAAAARGRAFPPTIAVSPPTASSASVPAARPLPVPPPPPASGPGSGPYPRPTVPLAPGRVQAGEPRPAPPSPPVPPAPPAPPVAPRPPRPPTSLAVKAAALDGVRTPAPPPGEERMGDRTVALPAGLPPIALPGAAGPSTPVSDDDLPADSPLLRTIELPPPAPVPSRVQDSGDTPIVLAPSQDATETIVSTTEAELAAARASVSSAVSSGLGRPAADPEDALERTMVTAPPAELIGGIDRNAMTQPVERPELPPRPTGRSARAQVQSPQHQALAHAQTQPMPRGGLESAPPPNEPRFDAMGETMPIPALQTSSSGEDLIGQVVHNRYKIVSKLGQGGMGVVYKAEHTLMGRQVAFKVLNPDLVKSAESVARFKREILAMAQFQHRNVVRIFDAGVTDGGRCYMAMELVDGQSLAKHLEEHGAFPLDRYARVFAQILRGLAEGHRRGIVHRDLKSENIYIVQENGDDLVKIMDFGIAKLLWADTSPQSMSNQFLTTERMAVGTPEYMSPEQASGGQKIDARSDLYSLGVVAYEMLTGKLPFEADSPVGYIGKHIIEPPMTFAERAPERALPGELERFVLRALEKDPESRWPSAEAMLVGLEQALPEQVASLRATARWPGPASSVAATPPAPPVGGPTDSASRAKSPKSPPKTVVESSGDAPVEVMEASGDVRPPAAAGGRALLLVLGGLLLVALLLVVAIVAVAATKRPSAEKIGQLVAERRPEVQQALQAAKWVDAKRILEGVAPDLAAGAPERKAVDAELKRVAEAEAAHKAFGEAQRAIDAEREALRRAVAAEELPVVDEVLARLRTLDGERTAARDRLKALELEGLAPASVPVVDGAIEQQLAPLREAGKEEALVAGLLKAVPPDLDGAIDRLQRLLDGAKSAARRAALEKRLRGVKALRSVDSATREMQKSTPNLQRAIDLLGEAIPDLPTVDDVNAAKALLVEAKDRKSRVAQQQARSEVGALVQRADAATSAGNPEEAVEHLTLAKQRLAELEGRDTWSLDERLTSAKAELAAKTAQQQLPPVPPAGAAASQVAAAIDARKAFLAAYPRSSRVAGVRAELQALEARDKAGGTTTPGTGAPGTGTSPDADAGRAAVVALLEQTSAALARADWAEAAALASSARTKAAPLGPSDPLLALAIDRAEMAKAGPQAWTRVGDLLFGKFEVRQDEYWKFCRAQAQAKAKTVPWPPHWKGERFEGGQGARPVGNVSFLDAQAYCAWLSGLLGLKVRLPKEEEWVRLAAGEDKRTYPWGPTWEPDRAVWGRKDQDGPLAPQAVGFDGSAGASAAGAWHLSGNVAEWVDSPWPDRDEGPDESARIVKGGSYRSFTPDSLTTAARVRGGLTERKLEWGFRVVIELTPGR